MRYTKLALLLLMPVVVSCSEAPPATAGSGGRQYSWIDANGRMHTSIIPESGNTRAESPNPSAQSAPADRPAVSQAAQTGPSVRPTPVSAAPAAGSPEPAATSGNAAAAAGPQALPAPAPDRVFANDDQFIDSQELEQKHFNPDGSRKFVQSTDAGGHMSTLYFDAGDGDPDPKAMVPSPADQVYPVLPVMPGETAWPLRGIADDCCAVVLKRGKEFEDLSLHQAYRSGLQAVSCLAQDGCLPLVLALDGKRLKDRQKDYGLRFRSYLSSLSCPRCVAWATLVVLDRNGKALRAYHPDLGGYRAETLLGFASFGYDITLHPDDAFLLVLADPKGAVKYASKSYKVVDKGEIAFSLIQ